MMLGSAFAENMTTRGLDPDPALQALVVNRFLQ